MSTMKVGKIEFAAANFFAVRMREVEVEVWPDAARAYFIHRDRIVAVAVLTPRESRDAIKPD